MKKTNQIFINEIIESNLDVDNLINNPIQLAKDWYDDSLKADGLDPNAMALATCGSDMKPSVRIVLLKKIHYKGFIFYTNYNSIKASQIEKNENAAFVMYWPHLQRQLRVEGRIEKLSDEESDEYFDSRPEGSRIGAWASPQSKVIPDRSYLDNLKLDFENALSGKSIVRPSFWGGYILIPNKIEFWKERENRLHDRIEYLYNDGKWTFHRLAP